MNIDIDQLLRPHDADADLLIPRRERGSGRGRGGAHQFQARAIGAHPPLPASSFDEFAAYFPPVGLPSGDQGHHVRGSIRLTFITVPNPPATTAPADFDAMVTAIRHRCATFICRQLFIGFDDRRRDGHCTLNFDTSREGNFIVYISPTLASTAADAHKLLLTPAALRTVHLQKIDIDTTAGNVGGYVSSCATNLSECDVETYRVLAKSGKSAYHLTHAEGPLPGPCIAFAPVDYKSQATSSIGIAIKVGVLKGHPDHQRTIRNRLIDGGWLLDDKGAKVVREGGAPPPPPQAWSFRIQQHAVFATERGRKWLLTPVVIALRAFILPAGDWRAVVTAAVAELAARATEPFNLGIDRVECTDEGRMYVVFQDGATALALKDVAHGRLTMTVPADIGGELLDVPPPATMAFHIEFIEYVEAQSHPASRNRGPSGAASGAGASAAPSTAMVPRLSSVQSEQLALIGPVMASCTQLTEKLAYVQTLVDTQSRMTRELIVTQADLTRKTVSDKSSSVLDGLARGFAAISDADPAKIRRALMQPIVDDRDLDASPANERNRGGRARSRSRSPPRRSDRDRDRDSRDSRDGRDGGGHRHRD